MNIECKSCGADLDTRPSGEPCPSCGETGRIHYISAECKITLSATASITEVPHWTNLLATANALFDSKFYGSAIIVAQTACEVVMARAITNALISRGVGYLDKPISELVSSYSPNNENTRRLYNSLTGDNVAGLGYWKDYKLMVERRHDCVHEGAHRQISEQDARQGIDAATRLIEHIAGHNGLP
jgi:predicted RNA-binding Zn-ribbon protein involved in translation (DUF1610 family)